MYNDEVNRLPSSEAEMWDVLGEQFEFARMVLAETPVETREEALSGSSWKRSVPGFAIRYRGVSEENDLREHYLEMGQGLLDPVAEAISARQMTPEFMQQWGQLMFCHGYLASYALDDSDDLAHQRAGYRTAEKRSKDSQRHWLARLIVPLVDRGMSREQAEERVGEIVADILRRKVFSEGFAADWYAPMLTGGYLASTYDSKHFSLKRMRALVAEPAGDIPPIPEIP